mgnify:CR=1 FL=1
MRLSKKIKVGIDSPSAAGAGTLSKMLAAHYNLLYCDTGKVYRFLAKSIIISKPKSNYLHLKKISKKVNLKKLQDKSLLSDEVAFVASQIAKDLKIRKLVVKFQKNLAYHPPKKFNGSILDGRDINSKIVKNADFKFYVTASLECRTKRRFLELKKLGKRPKYREVLQSINHPLAEAVLDLREKSKMAGTYISNIQKISHLF